MSENLKEDILRAVAENQRLNSDLTLPTDASQGGLYGWICPKCGAVMSPYQNFCVKCSGGFEFTWTANTNTTGTKYTIPSSSECSVNADKSRCHKCVNEYRCSKTMDKEGECPDYKRDAPDGGYYG